MERPLSSHGQAASLARRLRTLEEGTIRARAAARVLQESSPEEAALLLAELLAWPGEDGGPARIAVGQALLDPESGLQYEQLAAIYQEAVARGLEAVTHLLLSPPPHKEFREPFDKADPRLAHLSLGHKKSFARLERDPDLLARLAAEGEPSVVRELLRNPQLTEPFAVRIAARRPCRPETLRSLYDDRRWRTRPAVALALARNPYLEAGVALKILPSLGTRELSEIAQDGSLHPLVRAMAARLASGRAGEEPGGSP
jgi:hypothetical protein